MTLKNLAFIQICCMLIALGVFMHDLVLRREDYRARVIPTILIMLFYMVLAVLIGFRDVQVGTDTPNYQLYVWPSILGSTSYAAYLKEQAGNTIGGAFYYYVLKYAGLFFQNFLLFHVMILFGAIWWFSRQLRKGHEYIMATYWVLGLPFWSLSINILRASFCIAALLLSLSFFRRNKTLLGFLMTGLAVSFHYSSLVVLLAFGIAHVLQRRAFLEKAILLLTILLAGLSVTGIDALILDRFLSAYSLNLNSIQDLYQTGFRWDFALFNVAAYLLMRYQGKPAQTMEIAFREFLLRSYLVLTGAFFLAFNFPYSDRIGMYSWIVIPIICFMDHTTESNELQSFYRNKKIRLLILVLLSVGVQLKGFLFAKPV